MPQKGQTIKLYQVFINNFSVTKLLDIFEVYQVSILPNCIHTKYITQ